MTYPNQAGLPGPWGAQRVVLPSPASRATFFQVRTHLYPRFSDRVAAFFRTPMVQAMISPMLAISSYNKSPAGGMGVIAQERDAMAELRLNAFMRNTGIDPRAYRPEAVVPTYMPPVVRERVRSGAGVVPYHSISYQPRLAPPAAVVATMQTMASKINQARRGSVQTQMAMANREAIIRRAFGG